MDRDTLERLSKDDLIRLVLAQAAQIAPSTERVAAREGRLGLPPRTPDNSSLPPSKGHEPSLPFQPAGARTSRQFVGRVAGFGLTELDALPWDDVLREVETAMQLREDLAP